MCRFIPVLTKQGKYVLLLEEEFVRLRDEGKIVGRDFVVEYDGPGQVVQVGGADKTQKEEAPQVSRDSPCPRSILTTDDQLARASCLQWPPGRPCPSASLGEVVCRFLSLARRVTEIGRAHV